MKEYIEREAVLQQFDIVDTVLKDDDADSAFKEFAIKISVGAIGIIKAIPAADVVEVVRCKDCIYWDCYGGEDDYKGNCEALPGLECCMYEDDYCSSGERMDKEE